MPDANFAAWPIPPGHRLAVAADFDGITLVVGWGPACGFTISTESGWKAAHCRLCGKTVTARHIESANHVKKVRSYGHDFGWTNPQDDHGPVGPLAVARWAERAARSSLQSSPPTAAAVSSRAADQDDVFKVYPPLHELLPFSEGALSPVLVKAAGGTCHLALRNKKRAW